MPEQKSYPGVGTVVDRVYLGNEVMVVAFRDHVGGWAAYIGARQDTDEKTEAHIAKEGHKLYTDEAFVFFPNLPKKEYRR
jgi:hypothetical protein